jgi:hypothetical protein
VPGTWTVVRLVGNPLSRRGAPLPFGS